jgi:hypothetical protein
MDARLLNIRTYHLTCRHGNEFIKLGCIMAAHGEIYAAIECFLARTSGDVRCRWTMRQRRREMRVGTR